MSKALSLYDTTIGKKLVMALTGVVLLFFLVAHMLGNLQVFVGRQAINDYASLLHGKPVLLWGARGLLAGSALLHVWTAAALWRRNRVARPVRYRRSRLIATSYAARTMIWTGPIMLLYLGFHLAHLTLGATDGLGYVHQPDDVYGNLVASFRQWPLSVGYVAASIALGLHLYHGAWSLLQTLGLSHPRYGEPLRSVAMAVSLVVAVGLASVPVGVLLDQLGLVRLLG